MLTKLSPNQNLSKTVRRIKSWGTLKYIDLNLAANSRPRRRKSVAYWSLTEQSISDFSVQDSPVKKKLIPGKRAIRRCKQIMWVNNWKNGWVLWNYIYTGSHVRMVGLGVRQARVMWVMASVLLVGTWERAMVHTGILVEYLLLRKPRRDALNDNVA